MKKVLSVILCFIMLFSFASVGFAAWERKSEIGVEIQGITKTLFDDNIKISKTATVLDALKATGLDVVTKETEYGTYIVSIGGDTEKTFGGWDGWLVELGGEELTTSVDQAVIGENVNVLAYYGDPYGVGMQYPRIDQNINDGVITITSFDTVTDWATGESETTENPIVGATVTFTDDDVVLVTDEEGKVYITDEMKSNGVHNYIIEKYAENGLPIVLRTHYWYSFGGGTPPKPIVKVVEFFYNIYMWFVNIFQKIAAVFNR